ncbi:MAG: S8 family serine peptidase [Paracoccaceae bacterium]
MALTWLVRLSAMAFPQMASFGAPHPMLVSSSSQSWIKAESSAVCRSTRTTFEEAYQAGARNNNNSWGADVAARYTFSTIEVDEFVDEHPHMTVVIASGNDGSAHQPVISAAGDVDWLSVGAPATSKNAITVGASRSDRTQGGYSDHLASFGTEIGDREHRQRLPRPFQGAFIHTAPRENFSSIFQPGIAGFFGEIGNRCVRYCDCGDRTDAVRSASSIQ